MGVQSENNFKYTICFIRQGDQILMLNRESPSWMGRWNGLGGKIEKGESPLECVLREVNEEAGIQLAHAECKGIVSWTKSGGSKGGMYVFVAELPEEVKYETPRKTDEGIIDWKEISWIIHPKNLGVAALISEFLPKILEEDGCYEYQCMFNDGEFIGYKTIPLSEVY